MGNWSRVPVGETLLRVFGEPHFQIRQINVQNKQDVFCKEEDEMMRSHSSPFSVNLQTAAG